ncbi:MAG: TetR family transcriptional regulator [Deltaproteobacteria bacterium]|nr:TetR family transcriptional regulator [Deltaproteobacteria bacterium]MBW2349035.1 TetR family transcriptional regulator [Deltaproteobacteria bacterium]
MTNKKRSSKKIDNPRYQSILDAAAKIFREKGYHHANISEIAREVGLQKGSLYHHIKSKEELLYEIVISAVDLYIESLREILTSKKIPGAAIREAIIAHLHPIDIQFDRIYVFLNEMQNLSDQYRKEVDVQIEKYERLWVDILERGKSTGVFRADLDTKITVLSIFGMCNWSLRWYRPGGKYDTRELAEMYARTILDGIKRV